MMLGAQPLILHAEASAGGFFNRTRLRSWNCAWAVNSRYASGLRSAGLPYAVWEATTLSDELMATNVGGTRRSGRGSGIGLMAHRLTLPIDRVLERGIYRAAQRVYAMSEYTRERILARHDVDASTVEVLPHPPSPEFFAVLSEHSSKEGRSNRSGTALRLLFVGRVDDPRKNFGLLADALAGMTAPGIEPTVSVMGPVSDAWLRETGLRDDRIIFRGAVSTAELVQAYRSHDILVLSSRQEGFGIVVAEALHTGMPVIATKCGGPEATITNSGAGILCDHSPEALVDAITTLGADPVLRARMAASGQKYARAHLSAERFAQRVREATQELLASSVRARS